MSTYINEALRFYRAHEINGMLDTVHELANTIQTLIQTRDMLLNRVDLGEDQLKIAESAESLEGTTATDRDDDSINQVLANSIESICQLF